MARRLISSGSTFEQDIGYSRAVVDGDWVFVSGTTGFDYASMTIAPGVVEQAEQCMKNISHALEQAGSSLRDVVRDRWPDETHLYAALLEHPEDATPQFHVHVAEKLSWIKLADGLPQHERSSS